MRRTQLSAQPTAASLDDTPIARAIATAATGVAAWNVDTFSTVFGSQSFTVLSLEAETKMPLSTEYQSTAVTLAMWPAGGLPETEVFPILMWKIGGLASWIPCIKGVVAISHRGISLCHSSSLLQNQHFRTVSRMWHPTNSDIVDLPHIIARSTVSPISEAEASKVGRYNIHVSHTTYQCGETLDTAVLARGQHILAVCVIESKARDAPSRSAVKREAPVQLQAYCPAPHKGMVGL
jgi:hypothetical protein